MVGTRLEEQHSTSRSKSEFDSSGWRGGRRARGSRPARWRAVPLICCFWLVSGCFVGTARAHKVILFATVQVGKIEGEVYYQGGEPARNAKITVEGPHGEMLSTLTADEEGRFSYQPRSRQAHRLVADAGMGHQAAYVVPAKELPEDLPTPPSDDSSPSHDHATPHEHATAHDHAADHDHATDHQHSPLAEPAAGGATEAKGTIDDADVGIQAGEIDALNQQIAALRTDMKRWHTRLRWQDIVGGCGYILGIFGVWVLARRQQDVSEPGKR